MGYHSAEVTGYTTATSEVICAGCADKRVTVKRTSHPIFAGDETDAERYCEWCGHLIVTTVEG